MKNPFQTVTNMRLLFLAHLFPLPLDSGGKIKSFYTLRTLAEHHDVRVLAYVRTAEERGLIPALQKICPVDTAPLKRSSTRQAIDLAGSLLLGRSFIVTRDYRAEMQRAFDNLVASFKPEVVHADHLQMAQFVRSAGTYRTVLDHHNVESLIIRRVSETSESAPMRLYAKLEWPKLQRYEIEACRRFDTVLTVSEEDRHSLAELGADAAKIEAVPIGVDVNYFQPIPLQKDSKNILSVGTMYWPPNVDSILYFCKDVLPAVREKIPDSILTVAGQRPTADVWALAKDPRIRVTGYVDDVRKVAYDCGVFIVPLRSGSGVRVKILNAMAMGLPVVSTSIGAEGLEIENGKHAIIADTPEGFADAVVRVLSDYDLAQSLGSNGRDLVCARYSWEAVGKTLLDVYDRRLSDGREPTGRHKG